jgi:hypothetical protein
MSYATSRNFIDAKKNCTVDNVFQTVIGTKLGATRFARGIKLV